MVSRVNEGLSSLESRATFALKYQIPSTSQFKDREYDQLFHLITKVMNLFTKVFRDRGVNIHSGVNLQTLENQFYCQEYGKRLNNILRVYDAMVEAEKACRKDKDSETQKLVKNCKKLINFEVIMDDKMSEPVDYLESVPESKPNSPYDEYPYSAYEANEDLKNRDQLSITAPLFLRRVSKKRCCFCRWI